MATHRLSLTQTMTLAAALVLAALAGCKDTTDGDVLPGRMELISRKPVTLTPPNLLDNGGFEEWVAGAPAPAGFGAPSGQFTTIERETKDVFESESAVRQTWKGSDAAGSFWRQFHVTITGIMPDTTYHLSVRAKNLSTNTVVIAASHVDTVTPPSPSGERRINKIANIVQIGPTEAFQEFNGSFTTKPGCSGQILLSAACLADGNEFPATVIWDDWRLAQAPEKGP